MRGGTPSQEAKAWKGAHQPGERACNDCRAKRSIAISDVEAEYAGTPAAASLAATCFRYINKMLSHMVGYKRFSRAILTIPSHA